MRIQVRPEPADTLDESLRLGVVPLRELIQAWLQWEAPEDAGLQTGRGRRRRFAVHGHSLSCAIPMRPPPVGAAVGTVRAEAPQEIRVIDSTFRECGGREV